MAFDPMLQRQIMGPFRNRGHGRNNTIWRTDFGHDGKRCHVSVARPAANRGFRRPSE